MSSESLWPTTGNLAVLVVGVALIAGLIAERVGRKRAQREASTRQRELTHLSRVVAIGELSGALAHELNQPLTAVINNGEALQRRLAAGNLQQADLRDALDDIVSAGKRAADVIDHLRLLLKKHETGRQPVDLNEIITRTIALTRTHLVARDVRILTRLAPEVPAVLGDRVQLQQVLVNLILNACDAMQATDRRQRAIGILSRVAPDGSIQICVTDRGRGLAADQAERMFEPFVTSKPEGLGLGLAICRTILDAHHGSIWAANNAGSGASFFVSLPAHPRAGVRAAA